MAKKIQNDMIELAIAKFKKHGVEANYWNYRQEKRFMYFKDLETLPEGWVARIDLNITRLDIFPPEGKKMTREEIIEKRKANKYLLEIINEFVDYENHTQH